MCLATSTFGNIFGNLHPEKKRHFCLFFERNPLPGSDSARHLEPDAIILVRFGAVRAQISHKTHFSESFGATFWPKMFRAQIVRGNVGQGRILRGIFYLGYFSILVLPVSHLS